MIFCSSHRRHVNGDDNVGFRTSCHGLCFAPCVTALGKAISKRFPFFVVVNISFLNFEKKIYTKKNNNIWFSFIVGMAFGFGWTPCIGPILGSILALASTEETMLKAIILLSFYSLGLAIPFILSGYLMQKFLMFSKNFKKNINLVSKIGGVILLITGILILTNQLQILGYYILNSLPFLQNFG